MIVCLWCLSNLFTTFLVWIWAHRWRLHGDLYLIFFLWLFWVVVSSAFFSYFPSFIHRHVEGLNQFYDCSTISWDFKMKINNKGFYDRGFCYPISHERISGELAICRIKNQKSLEVFHVLFRAVYFNGQQQTEYHNKNNKTIIKNDCLRGLMINTPNGSLYDNLL